MSYRSTKTYAKKGEGTRKASTAFDSLTNKDPIKLKNVWKPKPLDSSAETSLFGNLVETKEIEFKKKSFKSRAPLRLHNHNDSSKLFESSDVSTRSNDSMFDKSHSLEVKKDHDTFDNLLKGTKPPKTDPFDDLLETKKPPKTDDDAFNDMCKTANPYTVYDIDAYSSPNQTKDSTGNNSDLLYKSWSEFKEEDINSYPAVKEEDFKPKPCTAKTKSRKTYQKTKSKNNLKRPIEKKALKSNETLEYKIKVKPRSPEIKHGDSEIKFSSNSVGMAPSSSLADILAQKNDPLKECSVVFHDAKTETASYSPDISSFLLNPNNSRGKLNPLSSHATSTPVLKSRSSISHKLGSLDSSQEGINISKDDVFLPEDLNQDSPDVPPRMAFLNKSSSSSNPSVPSTSISTPHHEQLDDVMEGVEEGIEQKGEESIDEFEMTVDSKVTKERGKRSGGPSRSPSYLNSNMKQRAGALSSATTASTSTEEEVDQTFAKKVNTFPRRVLKQKQAVRPPLDSWEQKTFAMKSSKTDSTSSAASREEGEDTVVKHQEKDETLAEEAKEKDDSNKENSELSKPTNTGDQLKSSPSQIPLKSRPIRNKKSKRSDDNLPTKRNSKFPSQNNSSKEESPNENTFMNTGNVSKDDFTNNCVDGVEKVDEVSKLIAETKSSDSSDEKISQIKESHEKITSADPTESEVSRETLEKDNNENKTYLNESTINKMSEKSLLEMAAQDGFDVNESILFVKPKSSRPKLKLQVNKKDNSVKTVDKLQTYIENKKDDLRNEINETEGPAEEVAARPGKNYRRSLSMQLFPERRLLQRSILGTPRQMMAHSRESLAAPLPTPRLSSAQSSSFARMSSAQSSSFAVPNLSTRNISSSFVVPNPPRRTSRLSARQSSLFNRHRQSSILTQTLTEDPEEDHANLEDTLVCRVDETVAKIDDRRSSLEPIEESAGLIDRFSRNCDIYSPDVTMAGPSSTPRITPRRSSFCIIPHATTPSNAKKSLFSSSSSLMETESTLSLTLSAGASGDLSILLEQEASDEEKLLSKCSVNKVVKFEDVYGTEVMREARKVGEGAFGEVFLLGCDGPSKPVLKVVPVAGDIEVNGEEQTKLDEMLSEVVISKSLSCLRSGSINRTDGFVEVRQCHLFQGEYPEKLLELWDDYDAEKTSENDRPDYMPRDQLYIGLEFNNGGRDLEKFEFSNATQALAAWKQVIHTVAVAENDLDFEHRDLHWGNVLVKETKETVVNFNLGGDIFQVNTQGVLITIIDFSLSRLASKEDDVTIFKDLANDPTIFLGRGKDKKDGDYQFDIYRKMRDEIKNDWKKFCPKTNIFWMHYLLDKMSTTNGVHYKSKSKKTAKHRSGISIMNVLKKRLIEDFDSATLFVRREGERVC